MVYSDLILNLTFLVAISTVSGFIDRFWKRRSAMNIYLSGILFGGASILGMLSPLTMGPGLIFDGRSIMISLCALFFGPFSVTIASAMAITCRIILDGTGMFTGCLVILSSAFIGLIARFRMNPEDTPPSLTQLFVFSVLVHLVMLAMMFTLPDGKGLSVIKSMGLPIMIFYPVATLLTGKVLSDQILSKRMFDNLQKTTQNLMVTLNSIGEAVVTVDLGSRILFMNPVAETLTGWYSKDALGKQLADVFILIDEKSGENKEDPISKVIESRHITGFNNHTFLVRKDGSKIPISNSASPIEDGDGKMSGVVLVFRDQTNEYRLAKLMKTRLDLLDYASCHSLEDLLTKALDEIGELVNSPIGFYHFVEKDQKTLSLQQWSTQTLSEFCQIKSRGLHYSINNAGVWADCIHQKRPVVHNDYESLPNKKGLPHGHARVVRELVVPIMREGNVVAVLGVGNKKEDYTDADVETVSYIADVTWQLIRMKRTEEVLHESEELFRNLFEHHAAIKLLIDPNTGDIIDANKAAESFYGWPIEKLRRMNIREINTLPPEKIKKEIERARLSKRVEFEFRHRRADGSVRDVTVYSSKITIKGKDLLHSIIYDITDRKQMEKNLMESEAKYRNLFENAPIGIFSTTSTGNALTINNTMARILGFSNPEDALKHYSNLQKKLYVEPEQRKIFVERLKEKGHVENFEYLARKSDDKTAWLRMNARISGYNEDDTFNIEGFTTDISDQVKLEEQFRQAQKMESVGRLAGGVAHDYNNMISVIIGYAELAMDGVNPSDTLYENLHEILNAAKRSADVTRQLLAFARKQTISPKVIDLNKTIEGSLKMLKRLIGEDIELVFSPGDIPWELNMDPSQIDQILANLSANARDAITGTGKITIETALSSFDQSYCESHDCPVSGDFLHLIVSDNGLGMDKTTLENLFEPFYTTKDIGKGTGLGLATVYGIVKQNKGFITVYSEPDKGTTFNLFLPRHLSDKVEIISEEPDTIPSGHGETILLVEDEPSILTMGKGMLEKLGYRVLTANTINEAVKHAKTSASDIRLLITDVVMPEMNGKDLSEHLGRFIPELKVLFMSGYTANVISGHGVLEHGVCFVQKPFTRKDFAIKVHEALSKNDR